MSCSSMKEKNNSFDNNDIKTLILENPWKNAYWFARMLISNDKYGAVGKNSELLLRITSQCRLILDNEEINNDEKVKTCLNAIRTTCEKTFQRAKTKKERIRLFCNDLEEKIKTITDVRVFILTAESIMIPINNALETIPSNDREFAQETAEAYLNSLGMKGLSTVINLWDDLGTEGSLNAERAAVIREFTRLRRDIAYMPELESNMILTAFTQEFERRLSQKRKSRAGGSLEDVTSFIFDYFGIKSTKEPEHFQADIEVDKWLKTKDGWLIGISCKRTLRERWKQVSAADRGVLSRYKIKELWHVTTYDEDLSDDKITTLGNQGHIFYLRDESRILKNAAAHIGMKDYVRPMSHFIDDIRKEMQ